MNFGSTDVERTSEALREQIRRDRLKDEEKLAELNKRLALLAQAQSVIDHLVGANHE